MLQPVAVRVGAGPRRALLALGAVAAAGVVVVYLAAVRTAWGQRLDDAGLRGRHVVSARGIHVAERLHQSISVASLVLFGAAILGVALWRGRYRLAVGAAVLIAGSVLTAEILKRVLPRPNLDPAAQFRHTASYPSGHMAVALSLAIAATFVATSRWRVVVAAAGTLFAVVVGCSVVVTASHRPSDPIGSAFVVTAWACGVAAVLVRAGDSSRPARPSWLRLSRWMMLVGLALAVAVFVAVAIWTVAREAGRIDTVTLGRAFVLAASAIVGSTLLCVSLLFHILRDVDLGRPPRARAVSPP